MTRGLHSGRKSDSGVSAICWRRVWTRAGMILLICFLEFAYGINYCSVGLEFTGRDIVVWGFWDKDLLNKFKRLQESAGITPPKWKGRRSLSSLILTLTKYKFQLTQQYNTKLAFKYNSTLQKFLVKNWPPNIEQEGDVDPKTCQECPHVYIGGTIKSLKTRISQHKYDIHARITINANYKHMLDKYHWIEGLSKFILNS